MKVGGTRSYAASREEVWRVLNEPAELARLMPAVESFELLDDEHWRAKVKVPLGLGSLRLKISFERTASRPPEHAALRAKGDGVGAIVSLETHFDLSEERGGTGMRWEADVRIFGRVASMGRRVVQPLVNEQVQSVLSAIDERVQGTAGEAWPG